MVTAHRISPVVQDRRQRLLRGSGLGDQQLPELPVPVLLHHEVDVISGQERLDLGMEREGPHAHVVGRNPALRQLVHRLQHRAAAPADRHQPDLRALLQPDLRRRQVRRRPVDLPPDAREHVRVRLRVLGVVAEPVVARAARQVGALGVHARQRAPRDPVPVHVQIAVERPRRLLQLLRGQHLAPVRPVRVVPFELRHDPVVHPDVQVRQHEDRRLEALGQIERLHRHLETLVRVRREDHDVPRIPVRRIRRELDVALLGPRRHPRRRAHPLHVEEDRRHLGVVGQPDELAHQREPGAARRGEGARARPRRRRARCPRPRARPRPARSRSGSCPSPGPCGTRGRRR